LIQGETGTGKELVARAIHHASPRAGRPFVVVDCAALPETLFESELFGHERGAFTGAFAARRGLLETSAGGTCFLDEIGELTAPLQAKLLRTLQERTIRRVGGNEPISVDVRVVAATNRDLRKLAAEGGFRDDLYYRLNVVTILLPPLRERREDLSLLMDHFLRLFAEKNRKAIRGFTQAAREALLRYDYPGNVRELENLIERAVVLTRDDVVGKSDLPLSIRGIPESEREQLDQAGLTAVVEGVERRMIREALDKAGGVQTRAAEMLGISERALRYKLSKYGIRGDES
jgi:two-component system NtrC family response regulator